MHFKLSSVKCQSFRSALNVTVLIKNSSILWQPIMMSPIMVQIVAANGWFLIIVRGNESLMASASTQRQLLYDRLFHSLHAQLGRQTFCLRWWVGVTEVLFVNFSPKFLILQKCQLDSLNHIHIWQVSPQLSCSDTCQILTLIFNLDHVFIDNAEKLGK